MTDATAPGKPAPAPPTDAGLQLGPMYQHPLCLPARAHGNALLRALAGEYDRDFTEARLAQIQHLLYSAPTLGEGATAAAISTMDG